MFVDKLLNTFINRRGGVDSEFGIESEDWNAKLELILLGLSFKF